jgi:predicted aspartyl protease
MKFKTSGPLIVFCRLKGPIGAVREVPAIIAPSFHHCVILKNDAARIGYPSVTSRPEDLRDTNPRDVVNVITSKGIELGTLVKVSEISVGPLKAENVEAMVMKAEFAQINPVGAFLGRSFLRHFKLEVDVRSNTFTLT